MESDLTGQAEEVTELLGKLVGRLEENSIALHILIALLEEKGALAPGEVDEAVTGFLRERGREYFVEAWGQALGEGLYEGLSLSELQ
jgi:hypothetical protein